MTEGTQGSPREFFLPLADSPDAACGVDNEGRIAFWNRACERLFGWPASGVMGRFCWEVLGGTDVFRNRYCGSHCAVRRMAEAGESVHPFQLSIRHRDGREVDVRVTVLTLTRPTGGEGSILLHTFHPVAFPGDQPRAAPDPETGSGVATDPDVSLSHREPLTQREIEILAMMAAGHATGEISRRLFISSVTVRNHVQHILDKLGVHSKAEAVAYAFRHRLV